MRAGRMMVSALILMVSLSGCGQKGPLYRDHQAAMSGGQPSDITDGANDRETASNNDDAEQ
ncbi:LPS translocon maturation chaperone LptM [Marinobacter nitratireducens]|nr:lipoprotein [Marinobacter nitratireducens]